MTRDPKVHHRRSIRLRGYDYARSGWYFLTISTRGKEPVFGEVAGWETWLNRYGRVVAECWNEMPQHYPRLRLDEFVVMPSHVHGIIELVDDVGAGLRPAPTGFRPSLGRSAMVPITLSGRTRGAASCRRD